MAIFECVGGISPTGNATPGDVKEGVSFSNENDVDQVGTFAAQEKTIESSRDNQIVTPDEGKYLSKVTVNGLAPSGTFTPTSRSANIDMGAKSNYRYVTTESVPNNNSGTYTFPSGDTGGTKDLGATNTYRYVNAGNVHTKGYNDGYAAGAPANCSFPIFGGYQPDGADAAIALPYGIFKYYSTYSVTAGSFEAGNVGSAEAAFVPSPRAGSLSGISLNTRYSLNKSQSYLCIRVHATRGNGFANANVNLYK